MANQKVSYLSKVYIPVAPGCCSEVILCLAEEWASRTDNGLTLVTATIENTGRYLGTAGKAMPPHFENPRCADEYQYAFTVDDSQWGNDPGTGQPWILSCDDIREVNPYACSINALIAAILA